MAVRHRMLDVAGLIVIGCRLSSYRARALHRCIACNMRSYLTTALRSTSVRTCWSYFGTPASNLEPIHPHRIRHTYNASRRGTPLELLPRAPHNSAH